MSNLWLKCKTLLATNYYSLITAGFLGLLFLQIIFNPYKINQDCALFIQGAQLLLEGQLPSVGFIDFNPPLIHYLNVFPVLAARLFSLNVILSFSLFIWGLVIWSTLTIRRLLVAALGRSSLEEIDLLVLFWVGCSFYLWQINVFGQREHLFILLYFPFFILRWARYGGGELRRSTAVGLGLVAGLIACLKPYFLIIALLPELYLIFTKRKARYIFTAEIFSFLLAMLIYALHFYLLPAVARENLFNRFLPLIAKGYHVYDAPLAFLFWRGQMIFFFLATFTLLAIFFLGGPLQKIAL